MGILLDDPLYDRFASRALCHALMAAPISASASARSLFHQRAYDWLDDVLRSARAESDYSEGRRF